MLRMYSYKGCDTCRKAKKWLQEKGKVFEEIPIRENPPSKPELKRMLENYDGEIRKLFNVSGQDYRSLNLKEKLADMSLDQAIDLLASNGNLIKRPFALNGKKGRVGFKPEEWVGALVD